MDVLLGDETIRVMAAVVFDAQNIVSSILTVEGAASTAMIDRRESSWGCVVASGNLAIRGRVAITPGVLFFDVSGCIDIARRLV